jgi:hypothetical protein
VFSDIVRYSIYVVSEIVWYSNLYGFGGCLLQYLCGLKVIRYTLFTWFWRLFGRVFMYFRMLFGTIVT